MMSAAFALSVKDAGTGECTVLRVAPTTTAAALKQRLLSDGHTLTQQPSSSVHRARAPGDAGSLWRSGGGTGGGGAAGAGRPVAVSGPARRTKA